MIVDHDMCKWANVSSGTGSPDSCKMVVHTHTRARARVCVYNHFTAVW